MTEPDRKRSAAKTPAERPRLRGAAVRRMFWMLLVVNALLFAQVSASGRPAVALYAASLAFSYGVSALYHGRPWSPRAFTRMRALDHSAIFVLIAGSYSPLFMLLGRADAVDIFGLDPLHTIWILAGLGVAKSVAWPHGPTWLTAVLAVAVGWSAIVAVFDMIVPMGAGSFALLVVSGVVYSIGGMVYALRRPNPLPLVFGYHEVFHALVILGTLVHYAHALLVFDAAGVLRG